MTALAKPNHGESIFRRTTIAQVYQLLTKYAAGTHRRGDRVLVRCPAADHNDANPSCYLLLATNTWYCFSCPTAFSNLGLGKRSRGIADMVIAAGMARTLPEAATFLEGMLGRDPSARLREQPKLKAGHGIGQFERLDDERLVDTYVYRDETGRALYRVLRYEGRVPASASLAFARAKEKGHAKRFVMLGHHGKRRVLYNLPEVIAAARAGRSILVVEGESKAKWLAQLGFAATTWANGSNSQWDLGWVAHFEGAPFVFLFCDADRTGRLKMREIATLLASAGRTVVTIDLYPDRTNGDDILNWAHESGLASGSPEAAVAVRLLLRTRAKVHSELQPISTAATEPSRSQP